MPNPNIPTHSARPGVGEERGELTVFPLQISWILDVAVDLWGKDLSLVRLELQIGSSFNTQSDCKL